MAFAGAEPGFVFCVRVGDNPQPIFRWVGLADVDAPRVVDDTLACLSHAHATADTPRVLAEEPRIGSPTVHGRSPAGDIFDAWTAATDPRTSPARSPEGDARRANIVTASQPSGMSRQEADELVAALLAPYPPRIQAVFRQSAHRRADQRKADRIAEEAARLGLEPSPPPEPLPLIAEDDIHLVCWQAITPSEPVDSPARWSGERADLLAPEQSVLI